MDQKTIEATYPITFRADDARLMGQHLRHHDSVVILGMKRVGISNFLRFFLHHKDIATTYIEPNAKHLFIPVDLNDLVEREIYPFWTLTLKRLVDTIEASDLAENTKEQARRLFTESIQLKDLFVTVDSVQKVINEIIRANRIPVLFLIRFDRLKDAVTPELFSNLQGLKDAAKQRLSYVFTSYRPLHELAPDVFKKSALSVFSKDMSIPPATDEDMQIILTTLLDRYHLKLSPTLRSTLIELAAGHVQYLQLAIIKLHEEQQIPQNKADLLQLLLSNEEITLQSEELYESLTKYEQEVLLHVHHGKPVEADASAKARYLWDTGILRRQGAENVIFNPLFADYVNRLHAGKNPNGDFTKKEHLLFTFLKKHIGNLCEREDIIEAVWPEYKDLGVSDWAIDRLVARARVKLKNQNSPYEIITVITRGYKLVEKT